MLLVKLMLDMHAAKMTQKLPNLRSLSEKSSGNLVSLLFHVFFQSSRLHLVSILFYASTSLTSESSSFFHVFRYPWSIFSLVSWIFHVLWEDRNIGQWHGKRKDDIPSRVSQRILRWMSSCWAHNVDSVAIDWRPAEFMIIDFSRNSENS